jgi:FkbM family methyltransferase
MIGGIPMRIRGGPNRGMRWSVVSAGRGAVAGTFEKERIAAITSLVRDGDCVWDIGAHKGYVTLAAATRVGASGRVYAFEPAPPNLESLARHVAWNELSNVEIMRYAVSSEDGQSRFGGRGSSITFKLGQGEYDVEVRSISSLIEQGLRAPTIIKIDVEGNESEVLRGAGNKLRSDTLVFVAIHSFAEYLTCTAQLQERGFRVVPSKAIRMMLGHNPVVWEADPDIIGIGPDRVSPDIDAAIAAFQR